MKHDLLELLREKNSGTPRPAFLKNFHSASFNANNELQFGAQNQEYFGDPEPESIILALMNDFSRSLLSGKGLLRLEKDREEEATKIQPLLKKGYSQYFMEGPALAVISEANTDIDIKANPSTHSIVYNREKNTFETMTWVSSVQIHVIKTMPMADDPTKTVQERTDLTVRCPMLIKGRFNPETGDLIYTHFLCEDTALFERIYSGQISTQAQIDALITDKNKGFSFFKFILEKNLLGNEDAELLEKLNEADFSSDDFDNRKDGYLQEAAFLFPDLIKQALKENDHVAAVERVSKAIALGLQCLADDHIRLSYLRDSVFHKFVAKLYDLLKTNPEKTALLSQLKNKISRDALDVTMQIKRTRPDLGIDQILCCASCAQACLKNDEELSVEFVKKYIAVATNPNAVVLNGYLGTQIWTAAVALKVNDPAITYEKAIGYVKAVNEYCVNNHHSLNDRLFITLVKDICQSLIIQNQALSCERQEGKWVLVASNQNQAVDGATLVFSSLHDRLPEANDNDNSLMDKIRSIPHINDPLIANIVVDVANAFIQMGKKPIDFFDHKEFLDTVKNNYNKKLENLDINISDIAMATLIKTAKIAGNKAVKKDDDTVLNVVNIADTLLNIKKNTQDANLIAAIEMTLQKIYPNQTKDYFSLSLYDIDQIQSAHLKVYQSNKEFKALLDNLKDNVQEQRQSYEKTKNITAAYEIGHNKSDYTISFEYLSISLKAKLQDKLQSLKRRQEKAGKSGNTKLQEEMTIKMKLIQALLDGSNVYSFNEHGFLINGNTISEFLEQKYLPKPFSQILFEPSTWDLLQEVAEELTPKIMRVPLSPAIITEIDAKIEQLHAKRSPDVATRFEQKVSAHLYQFSAKYIHKDEATLKAAWENKENLLLLIKLANEHEVLEIDENNQLKIKEGSKVKLGNNEYDQATFKAFMRTAMKNVGFFGKDDTTQLVERIVEDLKSNIHRHNRDEFKRDQKMKMH